MFTHFQEFQEKDNSNSFSENVFLCKVATLHGGIFINPNVLVPLEDTLHEMASKYIERGFLSFSSKNLDEFVRRLSEFNHYKKPYWPIVSHIVVRGPWERLRLSGISLLDIPGQDRSTPAMYQRYQDGIKRCNRVLILLDAQDHFSTLKTTWNDFDLWAYGSVSYVLTRCGDLGEDLASEYAPYEVNARDKPSLLALKVFFIPYRPAYFEIKLLDERTVFPPTEATWFY